MIYYVVDLQYAPALRSRVTISLPSYLRNNITFVVKATRKPIDFYSHIFYDKRNLPTRNDNIFTPPITLDTEDSSAYSYELFPIYTRSNR